MAFAERAAFGVGMGNARPAGLHRSLQLARPDGAHLVAQSWPGQIEIMAKKKLKDTEQKATGPGQPEWKPTEKQRGEVVGLTVAGYTQAQIADYFDKDEKTIRKHFRAELDYSSMKVIANCSMNVVRLANGVPAEYDEKGNKLREEIPMSLGPNAFILKTKGKKLGWSERLELTGGDGQPLMPDLSGLTNEQLEVLAEAERIIAQLAPEASRAARTGETTH